MASSGKFDLSSVSPDRPLYNSGQRGSYTAAASVERSSSFRDTMENPILSSLPSMSRSTSTGMQLDVTNFLQCLKFDPKSMATDHKFNRHGDFRRLAGAALGSPDGSPSGSLKGKSTCSSPEELKRLKAGLRESTIKARERVKIFSESLLVINKCFPSIPSRKRSRPDALPGDRASGLLLNRSATGTGKMGAQSHPLTNAFDFEPQKIEERGKNVIPNKRTRTSLVDQRAEVRPNTPARSSGNVDRDKEVLRPPNNNALPGDDRTLPVVSEGWEKTKMKKKRTGIKADAASSPSSTSTKAIDGYRETKQGMHPRHLPDVISRLNDSHGFRPGANGAVGVGKADGTSQSANIGIRSSIPRPEQESASVLHDKRDRSTSSEKERTNPRSVNKANARDEYVSGSPTSSTKLHATARGPRSGSGVVPKPSTVVQRGDWDPAHGTSKNPGTFGSTNRKRTPSTRSSSPPVAQWADRRPQKSSRTARRTNLVPIVSSNDGVPALDTSDVTGSENGPGFPKRFPANSPQQFKSKGDHFTASTLSESEESGAAEIRSRDKGKKSNEFDEKTEHNVQKMSTLVLPTRKNKLVNGEDVDGVRRQGRTGRGYASARGGTSMTIEKIRNVGTAKQLRTAKIGFDRPESKSGRPPTRKLSDRKAYTRQKHTAINAADFLVGSDDGHEELLAATNAVINPNRALSSMFWRQMEPFFGFVSDFDVSYIKQQESIRSTVNVDNSVTLPNGTESRGIEHYAPGTSSPVEISLCQRLLSALISEEGNDELACSARNDHKFNVYGSTFEFETDIESNDFSHGGRGFDHSYNGLLSDQSMSGSEYEYGDMSLNERLLVEIQSIGLYPELVPDLAHAGNEDVGAEIARLEEKYNEQFSRKKSLLDNLLKSANETRDLQEKEFEQRCLDKLAGMAYQKYMSCWGPNAPGGKSAGSKMAKQTALAFVRRTLNRCREFETTGKSCFSEPSFTEMFRSRSSHLDTQIDVTTDEFGKVYGNSIERVSGTQLSPSLNNHELYPFDQNTGKDDIWSSRVKKRELYLDDVAGASGAPTILNSVKGKRSERDRDGSRNGAPKIGRPASGNVKGERKTKTKLKQKATQLSVSINGPIGKISDQTRRIPIPKPTETKNSSLKENDEYEEEPLDFSHLQLPEMDVLGEQGQDIGSWLNIDDDVLQDEDFMGLEIPMDDLSDLNMMV